MNVRRSLSSLIRVAPHRHLSRLPAYESFESALNDSDGYEDPYLVDIVRRKTEIYRTNLGRQNPRLISSRQTAQNIFILCLIKPSHTLNVLEVGGACGASYFEMDLLLPGRIGNWSIVETRAMAAAGDSIWNETKLSFHSELSSASGKLESRDLAIAQGALQYASDPLQLLHELCALEFSHIYVTRTAVADTESPIFTRQVTEIAAHGPGSLPKAPAGRSSQPMTLVSFEALAGVLSSNYEILFRFEEGEERTVLIGKRQTNIRDAGFLARRLD